MSDYDPGPGWRDEPLDTNVLGKRHLYEFDERGIAVKKWVCEPPALPLPTRVGAVITWREDNDAGPQTGVFAELISRRRWRVNGFDIEDEDWVAITLRGRQWTQLEPRAVTAKAVLDLVRSTGIMQLVLLANPANGDELGDIARDFGVEDAS